MTPIAGSPKQREPFGFAPRSLLESRGIVDFKFAKLIPSSTLSDFARPEDCCAREHLRAARLERQSGNGVAAPKSAAGHGPAAFDRHAAETPFPAPSSSSRTQQFSGLYSVI